MKKKSLFKTNPYLKKRGYYKQALFINISTSTSIETGESPIEIEKNLRKIFLKKGSSSKNSK